MRRTLLSLISVLALGLIGSTASAFAGPGEWSPVGGVPYGVSTNLVFEINSQPLTCSAVTGLGEAIPNSSAVWNIEQPGFSNCTVTVKNVAKNWEVEDNNPGAATLFIPAKAAELEVAAGCVVTVEETPVLGEWTNGSSPLVSPSDWTFIKQPVKISSTGGCVGTNVAELSATFAVANIASLATEPITAN